MLTGLVLLYLILPELPMIELVKLKFPLLSLFFLVFFFFVGRGVVHGGADADRVKFSYSQFGSYSCTQNCYEECMLLHF